MTLDDIRTEVEARGFDYVQPANTRINRWINVAYQRINDVEAWPFLETELETTTPVAISDLRTVLSVVDVDNERTVLWEDPRRIRERDPNLDATGTPESWFISPADGQFTVYPADDNHTISIWYIKEAADLSNGSDEPLWPSRYHYVLVDAAVAEAYKDTDNFEAYGHIVPIVEAGITNMRNVLLSEHYDTPAEIGAGYLSSVDW